MCNDIQIVQLLALSKGRSATQDEQRAIEASGYDSHAALLRSVYEQPFIESAMDLGIPEPVEGSVFSSHEIYFPPVQSVLEANDDLKHIDEIRDKKLFIIGSDAIGSGDLFAMHLESMGNKLYRLFSDMYRNHEISKLENICELVINLEEQAAKPVYN